MADDAQAAAKRPRLTSTVSAQGWVPPQTTFTWKIEGLDAESFTGAVPCVPGEVGSPAWRSDEFEALGLRWQLGLVPNLLYKEVNGIAVMLELYNTRLADISDDSKLVVGRSLFRLSKFNQCISPSGGRMFRAWFFDPHPLSSGFAEYIPEGCMTIAVTLRARSFAELKPPEPRLPTLANEIAASFVSCNFADVVFRGSGKGFRVHSYLLALRSSTLRALLFGPMAQQLPSVRSPPVYDIPGGISAVVFRLVLAFIYTDVTMPSDKHCAYFAQYAMQHLDGTRELLRAADYLDLPRLRDVMQAQLHSALAPDNAVATLQVAVQLSCHALRDATLRYIAANAQAVVRTPDWATLPPQLVADVMHTITVGEPPAAADEVPAAAASAVPVEAGAAGGA